MQRTLIVVVVVILAVSFTAAHAQTSVSGIPSKEFARLPLLNDAELSPDGTRIAYLRPVKGRNYLMIRELGSSKPPSAIPPTEEADFSWLRWSGNDRLVFAVKFSDKRRITETTETRLISADKSGGDIQFIVRPQKLTVAGQKMKVDAQPPQIQDRIVHWLPNEPDHILVAIDDDFDAGYSVRRIDINSGAYKAVVADTLRIQRWMADHSGDVRLGFGYGRESFNMRVDVGGEWIDAENAQWWDRGFWPLAFTENPDEMFMIGPNEKGIEVVRRVRISDDSMQEIVFEHDTYDAKGLVFDWTTAKPVGVSYVEDALQVEYFDPVYKTMHDELVQSFPGFRVIIQSTSADRNLALVLLSGEGDPGKWYLWNRSSNRISLVGKRMPGLDSDLLSAPKPVRYAARDGTEIPAYLTTPKDTEAKNLPTIILPHGGPSARSDNEYWFLTQFLVSRGYAVLEPNFRGSTGYGYHFKRAGRSQWGGLMQDDVTDGANWLISEGIADPDRMCIVGWSYGGYAAAMATVKTPELFNCAVSINGVLNLVKLIADDHKYVGGSAWTEHIGMSGESVKAVSPFHQVERISTPILIIQAEDDTRVHSDHATGMARKLKKQKKQHELRMIEFGGHSMDNEAARLEILDVLSRFLHEHIGAGG